MSDRDLAVAVTALMLIATDRRPDGSWNRDREACQQVAADALARMGVTRHMSKRAKGT